MAAANTYVATTRQASWSSAQTVFQLATPAAKPAEIVRVSVSQETSITSSAFGLQLYRGGAAMTWTTPTAVTPAKLNPSDAAAASTVTAWGTTPTDGAGAVVLIEDGWNILSSPYLYIPVPDERIIIAAGSWLCLKFVGVVPAATYAVNVLWRELG